MLARVVESLHQIAPTMASQRKPSEAAVKPARLPTILTWSFERSRAAATDIRRAERARCAWRAAPTVRPTIDARTNPGIAHIARNLY